MSSKITRAPTPIPPMYNANTWPVPRAGDRVETREAVTVTDPGKKESLIFQVDETPTNPTKWTAYLMKPGGRTISFNVSSYKLTTREWHNAIRPAGCVWSEEHVCWIPPGFHVVDHDGVKWLEQIGESNEKPAESKPGATSPALPTATPKAPIRGASAAA